jgi:hypothetical protein
VPLEPLTVTGTLSDWFNGKLVCAGITVTVAVAVPVVAGVHAFTTLATFKEPSPVARSKPAPAL